jgi:hypothetical protein
MPRETNSIRSVPVPAQKPVFLSPMMDDRSGLLALQYPSFDQSHDLFKMLKGFFS